MDQGSAVRQLSSAAQRQTVRARIAACIWAAIAAVSVAAAALTAGSEHGRERMAVLFGQAPPSFAQRITERIDGEDLTKLSAHLVKLRSEMRLLALENEALAHKMARLESGFTPVATASLAGASGDLSRPENLPRQVYPAVPGSEEQEQGGRVDGHYSLEIGSGKDVEELQELWELMSERHREVLGPLEPRFGLLTSAEGEQRLLLRAGPLAGAAEAASACAAMLSMGAACSPVPDRGDRPVMQ